MSQKDALSGSPWAPPIRHIVLHAGPHRVPPPRVTLALTSTSTILGPSSPLSIRLVGWVWWMECCFECVGSIDGLSYSTLSTTLLLANCPKHQVPVSSCLARFVHPFISRRRRGTYTSPHLTSPWPHLLLPRNLFLSRPLVRESENSGKTPTSVPYPSAVTSVSAVPVGQHSTTATATTTSSAQSFYCLVLTKHPLLKISNIRRLRHRHALCGCVRICVKTNEPSVVKPEFLLLSTDLLLPVESGFWISLLVDDAGNQTVILYALLSVLLASFPVACQIFEKATPKEGSCQPCHPSRLSRPSCTVRQQRRLTVHKACHRCHLRSKIPTLCTAFRHSTPDPLVSPQHFGCFVCQRFGLFLRPII
jgi:hypothetical protein